MTDMFRLARIREIQARQGERAERLNQLRQELEMLEAAEITLHKQFVRARNFDPGEGVCPRCCIDDAVVSRMLVVTAAAGG